MDNGSVNLRKWANICLRVHSAPERNHLVPYFRVWKATLQYSRPQKACPGVYHPGFPLSPDDRVWSLRTTNFKGYPCRLKPISYHGRIATMRKSGSLVTNGQARLTIQSKAQARSDTALQSTTIRRLSSFSKGHGIFSHKTKHVPRSVDRGVRC